MQNGSTEDADAAVFVRPLQGASLQLQSREERELNSRACTFREMKTSMWTCTCMLLAGVAVGPACSLAQDRQPVTIEALAAVSQKRLTSECAITTGAAACGARSGAWQGQGRQGEGEGAPGREGARRCPGCQGPAGCAGGSQVSVAAAA